ncbi:hypothetical protein D8790_09830 [Streptococcus cristatus]|uniref:Uncharacterized protein n=1 Tax=Streptococcus cristatus TaxID=45634 RepID=A0A428HBV8_STRCR|nr:hypothetical protein D8790_09830 [Streptococcus cristatus]
MSFYTFYNETNMSRFKSLYFLKFSIILNPFYL